MIHATRPSQVIDDKIEKEIKKKNSHYFNLGQRDGIAYFSQLEYNKFYNNGYVTSAQQAASIAFEKAYGEAHINSFNIQKVYLDNYSLIENLEFDIVDDQGKKDFVIGQPVTLIIKNLVNIGRRSENLDIVLRDSIQGNTTLDVKGLSQLKDQRFSAISSISPTAKLGKSKVEVCIGSACNGVVLELKWENQIKALEKSSLAGNHVDLLSAFIRGVLLDEWKMVYKEFSLANHQNGGTIYNQLTQEQGQKNGDYVVDKNSYLGKFLVTMKSAKSKSDYKERLAQIGDDYLDLKSAMLSLDLAFRKIEAGVMKIKLPGENNTMPSYYEFHKLNPEQKESVLELFRQKMNGVYARIESDPV